MSLVVLYPDDIYLHTNYPESHMLSDNSSFIILFLDDNSWPNDGDLDVVVLFGG